MQASSTRRRSRRRRPRRCCAPRTSPAEQQALDSETLCWWSLMARRAPDGRAAAAALRGADGKRLPLTVALGIAAGDVAQVDAAVNRWFAEVDALLTQPSAKAPDAWQSERMEYAFTVAGAHRGEGETALSATQYCEGRLDWASVDIGLEVNSARPRTPWTSPRCRRPCPCRSPSGACPRRASGSSRTRASTGA
jgi:hypothetical protein